jgi:DNA-directed RNA polymerase subunit K/omega
MTTYTLSKYEKVRVLSTRATQLASGAPPTVNIDNLTDALAIAEKELREGVLPLKIIRKFPNGDVLEIPVSEMKILTK